MNEETKKEKGQVFWFDDDGKLIVETNKGIIADGEAVTKMYGTFTCNAKTLGMIIAELKGKRVAVGRHIFCNRESEILSILNPFCNRESEILAIVNPTEYDKEVAENIEKNAAHSAAHVAFNELPWYKKMFFKFKID